MKPTTLLKFGLGALIAIPFIANATPCAKFVAGSSLQSSNVININNITWNEINPKNNANCATSPTENCIAVNGYASQNVVENGKTLRYGWAINTFVRTSTSITASQALQMVETAVINQTGSKDEGVCKITTPNVAIIYACTGYDCPN